MSEADHKRPRRRAAGWLLAGILLLALCGAMAAFQASTAGSAASVVPNPRGQPFGSLSAAAVSAMASNESPTAADAEGVDWDYWRVVNPAIVAWVSVDGTAIDHHVGCPFKISHGRAPVRGSSGRQQQRRLHR